MTGVTDTNIRHRKYRLGRVTVRTSKKIVGRYRDYDIEITKEGTGGFYIYVRSPRPFGTAYDGYWGDDDNTIAEALQQAFIGSRIADKAMPKEEKETPGELEYFEGKLQPVVNPDRQGWWRFHSHYNREGYCDDPARGY